MIEHLTDYSCYDLLPVSSKQTVLDMDLSIKKALLVLLQNGLLSAPVWDASINGIRGILSTSDFLKVILSLYTDNVSLDDAIAQIEKSTIRTFGDNFLQIAPLDLIRTLPESSLSEAVKILSSNRVNSVLVSDGPDNLLGMIDRMTILKFVAVNLGLDNLSKTIEESGIGVFDENVIVCNPETPLVTLLRHFAEGAISAVPIVDASGTILDVCDKSDVINLIPAGLYTNLNISVADMLLKRTQVNSFIPTCQKTTQIRSLFETIKNCPYPISRFFVVDSEVNSRKLVGIVTNFDLLSQLST